ncbi:MAG: homoserine dehydrogenase, partial [Bacteroidia bacterium]|nr:homoserine dehydrogenase [Bacteroidia bacterium]
YILSKTAAEHISYAVLRLKKQEKGYAESDPTLDTGGFDAKYKLLILVAHAFGLVLQPADIYNRGIDGLGELELNYARDKGLKIKLVAHAHKSPEGKVRSFVLPKFVAPEDRLFAVDDVFNGVKTQSCFSDTQFFSGRGAGAHPTASAVLSDISALTYDYRYEYKKLQQSALAEAAEDLQLKVLLRHGVEEQERYRAYFSTVEESFLNHRSGYIIGDISLEKLREAGRDEKVSVVVKEVYTN